MATQKILEQALSGVQAIEGQTDLINLKGLTAKWTFGNTDEGLKPPKPTQYCLLDSN
jgi:hypothetical protein